MPHYIGRLIHIYHHRPGSNFRLRNGVGNNDLVFYFLSFAGITGIGSAIGSAFGHIGLNDIILAI
jgi:hypothetical protein